MLIVEQNPASNLQCYLTASDFETMLPNIDSTVCQRCFNVVLALVKTSQNLRGWL